LAKRDLIESLTNSIRELKEVIRGRKQIVESRQREVDELRPLLARHVELVDEITMLSDEWSERDRKLEVLTNRNKDLTFKCHELDAELVCMDCELDELKEKSAAAKSQADTMEADIREIEAKIRDLESRI
jgi:chromosome segregation ATPase